MYGPNGLLGTYSGTGLPTPLQIPSSTARVTFVSDSSVAASGFTATIVSVGADTPAISPPASTPYPTLVSTAVPAPSLDNLPRGSCSGDVSLTVTRAFTTPITLSDGPSTYASGMTCTWSLTASSSPIRLTFSEFGTESNYDFVRVYSIGRSSGDAELVQSFSGARATPFTVTIPSSTALVRFSSDSSVNADGFTATATVS